MFKRVNRCILIACGAALSLLLAIAAMPTMTLAATSSYISGTVIGSDQKPLAGVKVNLHGSNVNLSQTTDNAGKFIFPSLEVGTYIVEASSAGGSASVRIDLGTSGATVTLALVKELGKIQTTSFSVRHSAGTDVVLNQTLLTELPTRGSLPETLLQLPGAARGANGVVHINGDHGDYNYIVDGMPIPQELNREIGTELDPEVISFIEVLEGAYPAEYGGRFGMVANINTRGIIGPSGMTGYITAGSFGTYDSSVGLHTPLGSGALVLNVRAQRGDRFLDPPDFSAVHDSGSNSNEFVRYTLSRGNDFLNFTATHSYQAFQIPNDVMRGEPSGTDDNELQDDTFAALQYHHALRGGGSLTFGAGAKRSRIRDLPDQGNDFIYGEKLNLDAGGTPADCASGTVSACTYSLFSDRTARDVLANIDNYVPSSKHGVRFGALYDATTVNKIYQVTLQPGNFLAPIFTPGTPNAAYTVTDNAPNVGHSSSAYVQDTWQMSPLWTFDYGLRYDNFQIFSTQFARDFAQFSPRAKITRSYGSRANAYLYFGRFFEPFSYENVSPASAQLLNLPNQPTLAQFDLRPERASAVEIGGHLPLGAGELGARVMQKVAVDLIDDTQVGVTALHQDINYARGNISTQSIYYQQALARSGRSYFSISHTRAVNKGCETQLLAPCFGAPNDWTPADHDQRWDVNGGVLFNEVRGGWYALDGEYGSGLSSASCEPASSECKVPPHTIFDFEEGFAVAHGAAVTVRVRNIFNDRYRITYLNAQGNHFAAGRTFEVGFQFGSH